MFTILFEGLSQVHRHGLKYESGVGPVFGLVQQSDTMTPSIGVTGRNFPQQFNLFGRRLDHRLVVPDHLDGDVARFVLFFLLDFVPRFEYG